MKPISTRQLYRVVVGSGPCRGHLQAGRAAHAASQLRDPPSGGRTDIRIIQVLLGHAKLNHRLLHQGRDPDGPFGHEPARQAGLFKAKGRHRPTAEPVSRLARGRRHLPRCRARLSGRPCRASEPRPAQGDVGDRDLPHRRTRRPCRSLRGLRAWRIAYNSCRNRHCPKCQGAAARTWLAEREADLLPVGYFHVVFTLPTEIADIAFQNKATSMTCCSRPPRRRC
jgi:hypothetical protein